jgi:hypothetical protein
MFGRANPDEKPIRGTQEYDRLVIQAFGDLLASGKHATDAFHDVLALPYSKDDILTALENEMLRESSKERLEWLRAGSILLLQYQIGVGFEPAYPSGADPEGFPADPQKRAEIIANLKSEVDRAQVFARKSELEMMLIKARTDALIAFKAARETYRAEYGST